MNIMHEEFELNTADLRRHPCPEVRIGKLDEADPLPSLRQRVIRLRPNLPKLESKPGKAYFTEAQ